MALRLRSKLTTLGSLQSPRLSPSFSSSSSSSPFPPPTPASSSSGADAEGGDEDEGSPRPSYASLFSDIKTHLKQQPPSSPRRGVPLTPPDPPPLGSPTPAASLEEIRRNLSNFSLERKPPLSSAPPISFQDIYKRSVLDSPDGPAAGAPKRPSLESIRDSLRQLRESQPPSGLPGFRGRLSGGQGQGGPEHPLNLKSLEERLNLRSGETPATPRLGGAELLPDSIFGRELLLEKKREEGGKDSTLRKTEFLKMYGFEELGEKLRRLRPEEVVAGEKQKGWFSLEELNERLKKLRDLEKETEYRIGGLSFSDLRESLVALRDADNKKPSMSKFSILANLGGQLTSAYMLKPPKEHLVEMYFHPDHLSAAEKLKLELKKVRDEFKMSESDCGSTRVQVAQLTTRIRYLEPILYTKKKGRGLKGPDKHSIKGLIAMVKRRNKLLKYLRRTDWESYCMVLSKLELRDIEKKEVKGKKGSKEKLRGKKGKGKYSKKANYEI